MIARPVSLLPFHGLMLTVLQAQGAQYGLCAGSGASRWSRPWCRLRSPAPEGGVGRRRGCFTPCAPHCGHLAAVVTTLVPQGSVPRVRRPPSLGCPAALALGSRGAGEAESRSLWLLSSPGFPPLGTSLGTFCRSMW